MTNLRQTCFPFQEQRAKEMAEWLRVIPALPEDLCLVPNIHSRRLTTIVSSAPGIPTPSGFREPAHMCQTDIHIHTHK